MTERPVEEVTAGVAVLRIVRGTPTPEELAVVTAVVTSATTAVAGDGEELPRGRWNDPAGGHRPPLHPGPGGWRASGR